MYKYQHGSYRLFLNFSATDELLHKLCEYTKKRCDRRSGGLSGRGQVVRAEINQIGRIVLKQYTRGGMLQAFVRSRYVRSGKTRAQAEFELLKSIEQYVNVPESLGWIEKGSVFYQNWLISREILSERNLAEVSATNEELAVEVMEQVNRQVSELIDRQIKHIDLHPGNVLLDKSDKAYLIDFDRAERFSGRKNVLRDYYLCRWRRAVIKHQLPESLSEMFCVGMRKNFEIDPLYSERTLDDLAG